MEVHHHSHPEISGHRKKWTHYFWEFLMLFLAVFCGFMAENFREHKIEHHREKQYMQSLVEDLERDTAEISSSLYQIDSLLVPVLTHSLELLYLENISDSTRKEMYQTVPRSTLTFSFSFEKRTSAQLKNSGNLRLVRNKAITDSLTEYWYRCEFVEDGLIAGYDEIRKDVKGMIFAMFNFDVYEEKSPWLPIIENKSLSLLTNDPVQLKKLGNYISNLSSQLKGPFYRNLTEIRSQATNLILLIRKKYHLN